MNLLDLFVKISVDDQASAPVSKMSGKIGAGLKSAAKIGVAAIAAVSTAVVALGTQAMQSYADFEQLTGGIKTLFSSTTKSQSEFVGEMIRSGKSYQQAMQAWINTQAGANVAMKNADEAYKTAGMSANAYMETITSFAAALISSLGGDTIEAANMADQAITDMADNANKMGSDIQSIQNAYQGFAKQNYTMLDNLKLGYGGTKEEMGRLLTDAAKLNKDFAKSLEENGDSFANIVDAIHIIQTEMGIAGTTTEEISQTISGSVSAAKAAWENLLVAIASDDMDVGEYVGRFVDSLVTAADNVLPRAEQILQGISTLISGMAPVVSEMLPQIINGFLPGLLSAAVELVTSLLSNLVGILPGLIADGVLPIALTLVDTLLGLLPQVMDAAIQLVAMLAFGLAQAAPSLIPAAVDIVLQLCDALLTGEGIQLLLDAAVALLMGLAEGITTAVPMIAQLAPVIVSELVNALILNLPMLVEAAITIMLSLYQALFSMYPTIWSGILDLCVGIVETIGSMNWEEVGKSLMKTLSEGISSFANGLLDTIENVFSPSTKWLDSLVKIAPTWGKDMIQGIVNGIRSMISKVRDAVKDVANTISEWLHFSRPDVGPLREYESWMPDMIGGMVKGIEDNKYKLRNAVAGLASDMSANMTVTANGSGTAAMRTGDTYNITVNGAPGQDVHELVDILMEELGIAVSRKDTVFA